MQYLPNNQTITSEVKYGDSGGIIKTVNMDSMEREEGNLLCRAACEDSVSGRGVFILHQPHLLQDAIFPVSDSFTLRTVLFNPEQPFVIW